LSLLLLGLLACDDEDSNPTDVYVSFKTDLALASEVSAVRVRIFRSGEVAATATPVSEHTLSAAELGKKLPLIVEKREASDFLLAAQALGPGGANDPQVERQVKVHFQDGQSSSLQVFLGRACQHKACTASAGQTCFGESHGASCEGSCGPIDGPDQLPAWTSARADWQPTFCGMNLPMVDAGTLPPPDAGVAAGDAAPAVDANVVCTPTVADATCNAVAQCGCAAGKSCGVLAITGSTLQLGCVNPGTIATGAACTSETCVAGDTCVGSVCRRFCAKDGDCGDKGHCITANTDDANATPIQGLSACFSGCTVDADCATGCCRPLSSAPSAGKLCLGADACCAAAGASCTSGGDCCGFAAGDAVCVTESAGGAICRATCSMGSDCQSGCCAPLSGGGNACFAVSQCHGDCASANEACQTAVDCCGGAADTQVCVNQGAGPICADRCTTNGQCQSGCCAALQVGGNVCAPPIYCQ
jgi:hypothetical protein